MKINKSTELLSDWIFDFVLQFLESNKFDAAGILSFLFLVHFILYHFLVMDFVDEKCVAFDNEEENKFIYTDIHKEFKDHVSPQE